MFNDNVLAIIILVTAYFLGISQQIQERLESSAVISANKPVKILWLYPITFILYTIYIWLCSIPYILKSFLFNDSIEFDRIACYTFGIPFLYWLVYIIFTILYLGLEFVKSFFWFDCLIFVIILGCVTLVFRLMATLEINRHYFGSRAYF